MAGPSCVGALIRDQRSRVYVHRRSPDRRLFPGIWDVVGGPLEPGESPEQALAREIEEETGWTLDRIEAVIAEWEWDVDERHTVDAAARFRRYERDYLVEGSGSGWSSPPTSPPPRARGPAFSSRCTG
jgi:8-oxo-dGTP pyrophosphatase MutT (NUDIX family)